MNDDNQRDFDKTEEIKSEEENLESEVNEKNTKSEMTDNFDKEDSKEKSTKDVLDEYISSVFEKKYNNKLNNQKKSSFAKMMLAIILTSVLSSGGTAWYLTSKSKNNGLNSANSGTNAVTINSTDSVNVEKAVAKKSMPSVVGITTVGVSEDMFLRQSQVNGLGSGVIVSKDGYIITNNHVVDPTKTKQATVLLNDGSKHTAEILWSDKSLDLAVIKIDASGLNLQPVELGDSSVVSIGDKAIAIGSPLGINLQSTLTSGYISGKDRVITLSDGSSMEGLFQTDAAINPGNSGGALLNDKGQLIGINTAKAGNSDGIGFSIPINTAKPILEQIIKTGKFESVLLGIRGINVSRYNVLSETKLGVDEGVYIHEVVSDSPAEQSGLKKGDVITKVGDYKVNSNSSLKTALLNYKLGDKASVEIVRDGKTMQVEVNFAKFN